MKKVFNIIVSIIVIIIMFGLAALTLGNIETTQTANSTVYNASHGGLEAVSGFTETFGGVGTLIGALLILAIIFMIYKMIKG